MNNDSAENSVVDNNNPSIGVKKMKKYQSCAICFLVAGVVLVITSCFVPKTMDSLILAGAKKSSQLTEENEANWNGIPGQLDIGIYWNQYFYNCTNPLEVTYANKQPEFQEFGPFVYRESDLYENLTYSNLNNTIDDGQELPSVSMLFSQGVAFDSDPTGLLDTEMYLTNQALFGVWYQQNAAQAPDQVWRVYLTLLWSAVQDGLGRQLIETGVWQQMYSQKFKSEKKINNLLVHDYPVTDEQEAALYDDPYYGLSDYNNYVHWQNLMTTTDPLKLQMQAVWYWELRTYFGLSFYQVQEMAQNWNKFYNEIEPIVLLSVPAQDPYVDQTGVAYWQWADSYLTRRNVPPGPSVLNSTDTVTGYAEYYFWKQFYCNPDNVGAMTAENWAAFSDVEMYRSTVDPTAENMEYLFDLVDPVTGGDPAAHSLFNLTTLQTLISLGQSTPNVINDTTITYGTDFDLSDWTEIGTTLGLDEADDATMGQKRAYMTWLWMQTAWNLTFEREPEGGSYQIGVIGTLGATAFYDEMTTMRLEMPLLTISTAVESDFVDSGLDCHNWYMNKLSMTDDQANYLCTVSKNFTWTDTMQTAVALTNTYLYQNDFNGFYYTEFVDVTLLPADQMNDYLYGLTKQFTIFFDTIQATIKAHYDTFSVCTGSTLPLVACPFSKIIYSQWVDGTVLRNPLPGQIPTSLGYVINYGDHATGWITPEYGYWKTHNGLPLLSGDSLQTAIDETYAYMNPNELFNGKKWQDVLLYPENVPAIWPQFNTYCRSVTVNFGLSGLMSVHTPREMIEGYNDPLVTQLSTMPIYQGGDSTTSPFLSLVNPPTHPTNNTVTFFTGQDDFTMTRQYGKWLDQDSIMMKGKQYTSINEIEEYIYSPWEEQVFLDGSDGMQFSPDLSTDSVIKAFVNDLSRNCYFDYKDTSDQYPGLDTYRFFIQEALMLNETANPVNKNFDVKITGTSNMTTSLNAYGFVAKGHYYQLSPLADAAKPKIVDSDGNDLITNPENDDTYLGVEQLSGVCFIAKERIFFNMAIYGDDLFQNFTPEIPEDYGFFFPLAFVKRESEWTQDQVDQVYSPLILGQKLKWSFFGILLGIGLIFLGLTIFFALKYRKMRSAVKEAGTEPFDGNSVGSRRGPGLNGHSDNTSLLDDKDNGKETDGSEAEFDADKPHILQNERVFNLRGQGKPIAEMSDYTDSRSQRVASSGDVNQY